MTDRSKPITVLIADDHPIVRAGLRQIIEADPSLKIVGEADDGEKALRLLTDHTPNVCIFDVQMPKKTGLEIAAEISAKKIPTHVILLTMVKDQNTFYGALDLGVEGYVLKDTVVDDIVKAIHAVSENQFFVTPELSNMLLKKRKVHNVNEEPSDLASLTPAERRILTLIAELKSNQEIADALFISKRTVENHRVNIGKKLGITGLNGLLKFALQNKEAL